MIEKKIFYLLDGTYLPNKENRISIMNSLKDVICASNKGLLTKIFHKL